MREGRRKRHECERDKERYGEGRGANTEDGRMPEIGLFEI